MLIDTIVTDLDDTLLDANTSLSAYTMQVLNEAKRRGILVIPASGRAAVSMRPFVDKLNTGKPYIACNGAQLMNPDHTEISSVMFMPQEAKELLRYFIGHGFYAQVYRDEYFYFAETNDFSKRYSRQTGMQGKAIGDLMAFLDFATPKVLSVSDPQAVEAMYPVIQAAFPDVEFTISKPYFLEAQPKGVSKGSALQKLSELLGFSPERTMVFGDSLNDLSMLAFTKNSVAMANARPEVLRAARYVTEKPNAQDGLAHFIEDHILAFATGSVNV
ncbi:MAG TPA: Cof-type HAD-IIB family hydrolase [Candidatus Limiplasma sp.]|nr:Cof-type HAD-IIB family hydrolase [Candidatus Limiplasma sp.]